MSTKTKALVFRVVGLLILLAVLNLLAAVSLRLVPEPGRRDWRTAYQTSGLFQDIDIERLELETSQAWDAAVFDPYLGYRAAPNRSGRYISTDAEGFRETVQHLKGGRPVTHVAFFGGSTMWGSGARDAETIPSHFAHLINDLDAENDYVISNFGMGGFSNSQELILFVRQLDFEPIGHAVFFDFVNEIEMAYQDALSGDLEMERFLSPSGAIHRDAIIGYAGRRRSFRLTWGTARLVAELPLVRLVRRVAGQLGAVPRGLGSSVDWPRAAEKVVRIYRRNKDVIDAVGAAWGIETFFILQPSLFTKDSLSPYEAGSPHWLDTAKAEFARLVYEEARREFARDANFHDLSRVVAHRSDVLPGRPSRQRRRQPLPCPKHPGCHRRRHRLVADDLGGIQRPSLSSQRSLDE